MSLVLVLYMLWIGHDARRRLEQTVGLMNILCVVVLVVVSKAIAISAIIITILLSITTSAVTRD